MKLGQFFNGKLVDSVPCIGKFKVRNVQEVNVFDTRRRTHFSRQHWFDFLLRISVENVTLLELESIEKSSFLIPSTRILIEQEVEIVSSLTIFVESRHSFSFLSKPQVRFLLSKTQSIPSNLQSKFSFKYYCMSHRGSDSRWSDFCKP